MGLPDWGVHPALPPLEVLTPYRGTFNYLQHETTTPFTVYVPFDVHVPDQFDAQHWTFMPPLSLTHVL